MILSLKKKSAGHLQETFITWKMQFVFMIFRYFRGSKSKRFLKVYFLNQFKSHLTQIFTHDAAVNNHWETVLVVFVVLILFKILRQRQQKIDHAVGFFGWKNVWPYFQTTFITSKIQFLFIIFTCFCGLKRQLHVFKIFFDFICSFVQWQT